MIGYRALPGPDTSDSMLSGLLGLSLIAVAAAVALPVTASAATRGHTICNFSGETFRLAEIRGQDPGKPPSFDPDSTAPKVVDVLEPGDTYHVEVVYTGDNGARLQSSDAACIGSACGKVPPHHRARRPHLALGYAACGPRRSGAGLNRESGRLDLNQRPFGPQPNALPGCATPRTRLSVRKAPPARGGASSSGPEPPFRVLDHHLVQLLVGHPA